MMTRPIPITKFEFENATFHIHEEINELMPFLRIVETTLKINAWKKYMIDIQDKPKINIMEAILLLYHPETKPNDLVEDLSDMQRDTKHLQKLISLVYLLQENVDFLLKPYSKTSLLKLNWQTVKRESIQTCIRVIENKVCWMERIIGVNHHEVDYNEWLTSQESKLLHHYNATQETGYDKHLKFNFKQILYLLSYQTPFRESLQFSLSSKHVNQFKDYLHELLLWFRLLNIIQVIITEKPDLIELNPFLNELTLYKRIPANSISLANDEKLYSNIMTLLNEAKHYYIYRSLASLGPSIITICEYVYLKPVIIPTEVQPPYKDEILNNPKLAFLHKEVEFNNKILHMLYADTAFLGDRKRHTPDDNFIYNKRDNSYDFIDNQEWNKIYQRIVKSRPIEEQINKDTLEVSRIMYNVAVELGKRIPSRLKMFDQLIIDSPKFIVQIIDQTMMRILYRTANKERGKESHSYGVTFLSSCLGEALFKHLWYTSQKFLNDFTKISESDLSFITKLLVSILNEEDKVTQHLYKDYGIYPYKDLTMCNLLSNFILYECFLLYTKGSLPDTLQLTLSSYWDKSEQSNKLSDIKAKLTENYVQIGTHMVDLLEEHKLVSKSMLKSVKDKNYHTQYMVYCHTHYVMHLLSHTSLFTPLLIEDNLNQIIVEASNSISFRLLLDRYDNLVHNNSDIKLRLTSDCYLRKHRPHLKLTVDRGYYQWFLKYYSDLLSNTPINIDNINSFGFILEMYDINPDKLRALYKFVSSKEQHILDNLLTFALDFNIKLDKTLKDSVEQLSKKYKSYIKPLYHKVFSNKLFFVEFLKQVQRYSIYGYFIVYGFIDTRGRYYLDDYYFNIQNFPLIKAFIKPFSYNNITDVNSYYPDIQKAFIQSLKMDRSKKLIHEMSYDNFYNQFQEDQISYMYKFLDSSKLSRTDFTEYLNSLLDNGGIFNHQCLTFVNIYKKKNEYALGIISNIYQYLNPQRFVGQYYSLDASSSGLQMISILLQSVSKGLKCNLFGEEKIDIYTQASNGFKESLRQLKEDIDSFKSHWNLSVTFQETRLVINDVMYNQLREASLQEKFNAVINADWKASYRLYSLICDIFVIFEDSFPQLINKSSDNKWILNQSTFSIMKDKQLKDINKVFLKYFMCLYHGIWFFHNLDMHPWIAEQELLFKRDLFKRAIMTYGYNSTFKGRTEDIVDFFKANAPYTESTNSSYLYEISYNVEYYFKEFRLKELPDFDITKDISRIIADKGKGVTVRNKFFTIHINPCKTVTSSVNIVRNKIRVSQLRLRRTTNITDKNRLRTGFMPNFIHSMDAFIVHALYELVNRLNGYFLINKIPFRINLSTTHDCYLVTLITPYLRIMIEDCYQELIRNEYITTLKSNDEVYHILISQYFNSPVGKALFLSVSETLNRHYVKL